jgi:hypothetical protein
VLEQSLYSNSFPLSSEFVVVTLQLVSVVVQVVIAVQVLYLDCSPSLQVDQADQALYVLVPVVHVVPAVQHPVYSNSVPFTSVVVVVQLVVVQVSIAVQVLYLDLSP